MARFVHSAGICMVSAALFAGCGELRTNLPTDTSPGVTVHEAGWTDPASSNFHGQAIRAAGWDLALCRQCHGADYAGGITMVSCRTCHNQPAGPENCATCHGGTNPAPPEDVSGSSSRSSHGVGAHQKHLLGGNLTLPLICSDCHTVPAALSSPGHIDPSPAEVPMDGSRGRTVTNEPATTNYDPSQSTVVPQPVYDSALLQCSNTYCHGNFKNANPAFSPSWTDTTAAATACGTCHGDTSKPTLAERARPGGSHPVSTNCVGCHGAVVDASLKIIDKAKHMNGKLNVFGGERDF